MTTGPSTARTLVLMRHAETEAVRPGSPDRDRRLTPDGERWAAAVGEALRASGVAADLVVASSAVRARQTAEGLGFAAPLVVGDRLYNAGGETILREVRELEDGAEHVVLVAHAPGVPWAVHELADPGTSDAQALRLVEYRFPAGTAAVFSVAGDWAELERATLTGLHLP